MFGLSRLPEPVRRAFKWDAISAGMGGLSAGAMLPFFGVVHVGYIPKGRVVGLSKIPRIVDMFARRLQVQENMTQQIADILQDNLHPDGVGVVTEGFHMCMSMRGVEKDKAKMITSAMIGSFKDDEKTRSEFLHLIRSERSVF